MVRGIEREGRESTDEYEEKEREQKANADTRMGSTINPIFESQLVYNLLDDRCYRKARSIIRLLFSYLGFNKFHGTNTKLP